MQLSSSTAFLQQCQQLVGHRQVISDAKRNAPYRQGFRSGGGSALAVIFPQTLRQLWQILQLCVAHDKIIIMQAANTGLTEGSTPNGDDYDRQVVIINTLQLDKISVINHGEQVICFAGSTLYQLEKVLKPFGREPHSVIGSSCIGASVVGGVCNNSGGSLVQRGPAYTELALYAQLTAQGELQLVNHLGVDLGQDAETILQRLDNGDYPHEQLATDGRLASSANQYQQHVRDIHANTPARFNADSRHLFEASGCAGKLAVFAVRLDTFPAEQQQQVFYLGCNDSAIFTALRQHILQHFQHLPVAAEYMHRDIFDIAAHYGKDTFAMIDKLGTDKMPKFFTLKSKIDGYLNRLPFLPQALTDKLAYKASHCLLPQHLPVRLREYRDRYQHHLLLKVAGAAIEETQQFLGQFFSQYTEQQANYFACSTSEGEKAFLHRFVAAGAAVRYHAIHATEVEDILALDIALPRNSQDWFEQLPAEIEQQLVAKLYYGHFLCHVFHQDYIVKKGVDCHALKQQMLALLAAKGAEYPAEHNVGHLYHAKAPLAAFYQQNDPTNSFNPGIGKTSKRKDWQ